MPCGAKPGAAKRNCPVPRAAQIQSEHGGCLTCVREALRHQTPPDQNQYSSNALLLLAARNPTRPSVAGTRIALPRPTQRGLGAPLRIQTPTMPGAGSPCLTRESTPGSCLTVHRLTHHSPRSNRCVAPRRAQYTLGRCLAALGWQRLAAEDSARPNPRTRRAESEPGRCHAIRDRSWPPRHRYVSIHIRVMPRCALPGRAKEVSASPYDAGLRSGKPNRSESKLGRCLAGDRVTKRRLALRSAALPQSKLGGCLARR